MGLSPLGCGRSFRKKEAESARIGKVSQKGRIADEQIALKNAVGQQCDDDEPNRFSLAVGNLERIAHSAPELQRVVGRVFLQDDRHARHAVALGLKLFIEQFPRIDLVVGLLGPGEAVAVDERRGTPSTHGCRGR